MKKLLEDLAARTEEKRSKRGLTKAERHLVGKASNIVDRVDDPKAQSAAVFMRQLASEK